MTRPLHRLIGAGMLVLVLAPVHRLLDPARTGLAGATTLRLAEGSWILALEGTALTLAVASVLAFATTLDVRPLMARALFRTTTTSDARFALICAATAFFAATAAALAVFGGDPTSVDEMVQLLHARALLAGGATLPLPGNPTAFLVQNSLLVDGAWVSVYPPLHTLLLAGALALGTPWLVGPVAAGVTAGACARSFARLLPAHPERARAAAFLVALSPFCAFLGGSELSHGTTAAFVSLTLLFALRARDGGLAWAFAAGLTAGAAVATRPWTGLALCGAILVGAWAPEAVRAPRRTAARLGALTVGGAPFALLLLGWNRALFGSPFRLGYTAAYGPAHGLGFHADPWGNAYGVAEAVAYTAADIGQLGLRLFESPLPATLLIGAGLLLVRCPGPGVRVALAWAGAGVVANALYWHHGVHLGPRLLLESAPAWVLLWVFAGAELSGPSSPLGARGQRLVGWVAALSLLAGLALLPATARGYRPSREVREASRLPEAPDGALLIVHGSWTSRVAAGLVATGMRRDSVETALRRNDLCAVDRYARWRADPMGAAPTLDFEPRAGTPDRLVWRAISDGNRVLLDPALAPDAACLRQARADRAGTVELEPLLWQAPPVPGARVVVARDLGPVANEAVRGALAGYVAWLVTFENGAPRVSDYATAISALWGEPVSGGGE